ncbi:MAG: DUF4911 domain-containing protein [Synergistaceae bacterium]|nr:DUF4911 domain-containing protein [Synergistaceae bacterium]
MDAKEIYYASWNLDACDGLGFMQTDDAAHGKVAIICPANLLDEVKSFVGGLQADGMNITIDSIEEQ